MRKQRSKIYKASVAHADEFWSFYSKMMIGDWDKEKVLKAKAMLHFEFGAEFMFNELNAKMQFYERDFNKRQIEAIRKITEETLAKGKEGCRQYLIEADIIKPKKKAK